MFCLAMLSASHVVNESNLRCSVGGIIDLPFSCRHPPMILLIVFAFLAF